MAQLPSRSSSDCRAPRSNHRQLCGFQHERLHQRTPQEYRICNKQRPKPTQRQLLKGKPTANKAFLTNLFSRSFPQQTFFRNECCKDTFLFSIPPKDSANKRGSLFEHHGGNLFERCRLGAVPIDSGTAECYTVHTRQCVATLLELF